VDPFGFFFSKTFRDALFSSFATSLQPGRPSFALLPNFKSESSLLPATLVDVRCPPLTFSFRPVNIYLLTPSVAFFFSSIAHDPDRKYS